MAVEVASLKAVIDLDKKGLDSGLKGVKGQLDGFGSSLKGVMGTFAGIGVGIAALSGVTSAISGMVNAARESVAVGKQLEQVLISTNGVAGVTADKARDLAEALSMVTNFEDDAILKGEAMLLTFTNIGKDVFPRATEAMLDMAQVMGGDLSSNADKLGKILNNPIKGIGRLQKMGVTFTAEQQKMFNAMKATNDVAGMQGVILDALATKFGGQAKAMADPFIILQNTLGEIGEMLGMAILPPINALVQTILPPLRAGIEALGPVFANLGTQAAEVLGPTLKEVGTVLMSLIQSAGTFANGLKQVAISLGLANKETSALKIVLSPLIAIWTASMAVWSAVAATLTIVGHGLEAVAFIVNQVKAGWTALTSAGGALNNIGVSISNTWTRITAAFQTLLSWVTRLQAAWQRLISTMSQAVNLPGPMTPGSPTPLETGIRGISRAIRDMPPIGTAFAGLGGMTPMAGGGGASHITVNIGSVSATSVTNRKPDDEAVRLTMQKLRQALDRKS